mgnify:CR=1 FL=1
MVFPEEGNKHGGYHKQPLINALETSLAGRDNSSKEVRCEPKGKSIEGSKNATCMFQFYIFLCGRESVKGRICRMYLTIYSAAVDSLMMDYCYELPIFLHFHWHRHYFLFYIS